VLTTGGKVYFIGGQKGITAQANVDIYDGTSDTWTSTQIPTALVDHAVGTADGKIYIGGGAISSFTYSPFFEQYDLATKTWGVFL
jgi:Kelch motif